MQIRIGDEYSIDSLTFSSRKVRKRAGQRERGGRGGYRKIFIRRERIKADEYKRAAINEKHKTRCEIGKIDKCYVCVLYTAKSSAFSHAQKHNTRVDSLTSTYCATGIS